MKWREDMTDKDLKKLKLTVEDRHETVDWRRTKIADPLPERFIPACRRKLINYLG